MTTLALSKTDSDLSVRPQEYHWTVDAYHRAGDAGVFGDEAQLELIHGRVIDRYAAGGPEDYHWTADAFDSACDAGVFGPDARLELVHGRILERMGQGPLHFWLRVRVGRRLRSALEPHFLIVDECPVRIAFDGVPIADVAVLVGLKADDNKLSPTSEDVVLLVEIAVSTVEVDLGGKALLYAQAGITDYWVVLAEEKAVVVHREPTLQGYTSVTRLDLTGTLKPLAAPDVTLAVRDLLGALG